MRLNGTEYDHPPRAGTAAKAALFAICVIVLTALLQIGLGARGFF